MKSTVAAIDFGTSKIVTLISTSNANNRSDILGAGMAPYEGYSLKDDTYASAWHDPNNLNDAIAHSIEEAQNQAHFKLRDVYVGVPGGFAEAYAITVSLELQGADPQVTPAHIDEIFQKGVQMLSPFPGIVIHRSPAWFSVDDGKHTLEPVGMKGRVLRAMVSFIVADKMFLDDVNMRLNSMGLTVRGFFSGASSQVTLYLPEEERIHTAVLIDVGYLQTDVIVAEGDAVIFHSAIPVGGGHIAANLAMDLHIELGIAEQLKRQFVFGLADENQEYAVATSDNRTFKHGEIRPIIENCVEEIANLVNQELEKSGTRLGSWSTIYLTGGGIAMNKGGRDFFSAKLGRSVRDIPKRSSKLQSPVYSSSLGLVDLITDAIQRESAISTASSPISRFFRDLLGR